MFIGIKILEDYLNVETSLSKEDIDELVNLATGYLQENNPIFQMILHQYVRDIQGSGFSENLVSNVLRAPGVSRFLEKPGVSGLQGHLFR